MAVDAMEDEQKGDIFNIRRICIICSKVSCEYIYSILGLAWRRDRASVGRGPPNFAERPQCIPPVFGTNFIF